MARVQNNTQMVELREDLGANHLHSLLGFSALLEEYITIDSAGSEGFFLLIKEALDHFNISANEFSIEFGVHPSTVSRWAAGKSLPDKLVRPIIVNWIAVRVEVEISSYQSALPAIKRLDERVNIKLEALSN